MPRRRGYALVWVPCGSCGGQGRIVVGGRPLYCRVCLGVRERLPAGGALLASNDQRRPFHGWRRPE